MCWRPKENRCDGFAELSWQWIADIRKDWRWKQGLTLSWGGKKEEEEEEEEEV